MPLVVALACTAAALFALAARLQQDGAVLARRQAARAEVIAAEEAAAARGISRALPTLRLLHTMGRERIWLIGWVVNLCGFLAQAAALHFGAVQLVQPILVLQLLFSLPLTALARRRRVRPADWCAGALVCAGVALFIAASGAAHESGEANRTRILLAAGATAVVIGLLLVAAARVGAPWHALCVAVGAGLCFAFSAVLMKLTADDLVHRGVGATATDWVGYGLAASTALGLVLGQDAYATGSLSAAIGAMTITNPFASYVLGVLCFDVQIQTDPTSLAAGAAAGLLLTLGILGLARSPLITAAAAPSPPAPATMLR